MLTELNLRLVVDQRSQKCKSKKKNKYHIRRKKDLILLKRQTIANLNDEIGTCYFACQDDHQLLYTKYK